MNIIKRHLPDSLYSKYPPKPLGSVVHFVSNVNINPADPFNLDDIIQIFHTYKVSVHYLIDRDGTVYELVPTNHQAWHAGKSIMNGRKGCNAFTFGVELVSTGQPFNGEPAYPLAQINACIDLHLDLMQQHGITPRWIQGHDQVRKNWNDKYPNQRASVKVDPGPHFPWTDFKQTLYDQARHL